MSHVGMWIRSERPVAETKQKPGLQCILHYFALLIIWNRTMIYFEKLVDSTYGSLLAHVYHYE